MNKRPAEDCSGNIIVVVITVIIPSVLKKGVIPGGLGENSHRFEEIKIAKPEVGHRSTAFAAVDILELWSDRFREFLVDSVCK